MGKGLSCTRRIEALWTLSVDLGSYWFSYFFATDSLTAPNVLVHSFLDSIRNNVRYIGIHCELT